MLAAAVLGLGLYFLAVGVVVDLRFSLNPFVDVGVANHLEGVVSSAVVESLFGLIGAGLYLFTDVVESFLPLRAESLEGIPIQQMPPESFSISEFVLFP